jgi:hypothetical protein
VFFRHDEVLSYAMARLKADRFNYYCSKDPRAWGGNAKNESDLREKLLAGNGELIAPAERGGALSKYSCNPGAEPRRAWRKARTSRC